MSVSAVICEFNPFHNGHKYLLEKAKADGSDVICIMSGNFVQRGDIAVCDKYLRAEEAVRNGADLVIELPLPYACAPAETFARGAVTVLNNLKIVDKLYFGTESKLEDINKVLNITETDSFKNSLDTHLKEGMSYPDAFFEAAGKECLSGGNDILALEYLRQLVRAESYIKPVSVRRIGPEHNSQKADDKYASASLIRKLMKENEDYSAYTAFCPGVHSVSDFSKLETSVLFVLRKMTEEEFSLIADVTEGLEFRLKKAVSEAVSIDDLIEKIKTRRYTLSKIRRIILSSYLSLTKEMQQYIPSFVNVLASSERGVKLISQISKQSRILPVIRYSDTEKLCDEDKNLYHYTCRCDDIFGLSLPEIRATGYDMTHNFRVISNED